MPHIKPSRRLPRAGFSMLEIMVALTLVGVTSAISVGKIHDIMIQERIARAATTIRGDMEAAFALAVRNREPIRIRWNSSALALTVTNRDGSTVYRTTALSRDTYGLRRWWGGVQLSSTSVEIYPNGMASDTLTITFRAPYTSEATKRVRMSRAGLVRIE